MIPDHMFVVSEKLSREERRAILDAGDWSKLIAIGKAEDDRRYRPIVWELIAAGWTFELPNRPDDMMSWAWRRLPKRAGKPGRRFASTDQAWNALRRERGESTSPDFQD